MGNSRLQFEVHPSSGVPIYRQIIDQSRMLIATGQLAEGELLPSVRLMSSQLEINTMTVSKAYSKLEADGFIERVRGMGMRVLPLKIEGTAKSRKAELKVEAERLVTLAQQLGLSSDQILAVIQSVLKERF